MLEKILVVVGSGLSDIGKGWLTSALASDIANPLLIKMDPMLNLEFPSDLGSKQDEKFVTDDFLTYEKMGLKTYSECNLLGGELFASYITQTESKDKEGKIIKKTFAGLSDYISERLVCLIKKYQPSNLVIEIGGVTQDPESKPIHDSIGYLKQKTGAEVNVAVLTYFELNENNGLFEIKTRIAQEAVRSSRQRMPYDTSLYIRRRNIPDSIDDDQLVRKKDYIAKQTFMDPERVIFLPNVKSPFDLKKYLN